MGLIIKLKQFPNWTEAKAVKVVGENCDTFSDGSSFLIMMHLFYLRGFKNLNWISLKYSSNYLFGCCWRFNVVFHYDIFETRSELAFTLKDPSHEPGCSMIAKSCSTHYHANLTKL
jgi:hypothetical protein